MTHRGITSPSHSTRILRLVLLAPDIQEAILISTLPDTLTLADFMDPFPEVRELQRKQLGFREPHRSLYLLNARIRESAMSVR